MEGKAKKIAALLKVLANEHRLMLFCALMEQEMTVGELANRVPDIGQSALSQHLALLRAHGILDAQKNGQRVTYRIADHRVGEIVHTLRKHYCEPQEANPS